MFCEFGATDDELADFFKVHRSTIYRWKLIHPEFCDAVKTGKTAADERVERSLYQKATGYNVTEEQAVKLKVEQYKEEVEVVQVEKHVPADTTAAIFWLKNRRSQDWRDKQEVDHGGRVTVIVDEAAAQAALERVDSLIRALAGAGQIADGGTLQGQSLLPA